MYKVYPVILLTETSFISTWQKCIGSEFKMTVTLSIPRALASSRANIIFSIFILNSNDSAFIVWVNSRKCLLTLQVFPVLENLLHLSGESIFFSLTKFPFLNMGILNLSYSHNFCIVAAFRLAVKPRYRYVVDNDVWPSQDPTSIMARSLSPSNSTDRMAKPFLNECEETLGSRPHASAIFRIT